MRPKTRKWDVTATVDAHGVKTTETIVVDGTDPDAACGVAIGLLIARNGPAKINVTRIARVASGNSGVAKV